MHVTTVHLCVMFCLCGNVVGLCIVKSSSFPYKANGASFDSHFFKRKQQ